ncbi:hypothetical protein QG37_04449 [Candidozyma auris]|nr:hypothetical protein QG37_04449 [[Candida] auris]
MAMVKGIDTFMEASKTAAKRAFSKGAEGGPKSVDGYLKKSE